MVIEKYLTYVATLSVFKRGVVTQWDQGKILMLTG